MILWILAVLPLVAGQGALQYSRCGAAYIETFGQELRERRDYGNAYPVTMIDVGKPLNAGYLEGFTMVISPDLRNYVKLRLQIWSPVTSSPYRLDAYQPTTLQLDYEMIVDVPPSNGQYARRTFESDRCYNVRAGSFMGWTVERSGELYITYDQNPSYTMMYRLVNNDFPRVGASYTMTPGGAIQQEIGLYSIVAAIGVSQGGGVSGGNLGAVGVAGIPGQPGAPGQRGYTGFTGPAGLPGVAGRKGETGLPGQRAQRPITLSGLPGPIGSPGVAGPSGFTGATGPAGRAGSPGLAGARGQAGFTGATGPRGIDGLAGRDGLQGATGFPGAAGRPGTDGRQGPIGQPGDQGVKGRTGEAGTPGRTGTAGQQGATGMPGPNGISGRPGQRGQPGKAGVDGRAGLPGPIGATGLRGIDGLPGIAGQPGDIGATGQPGTRGRPGTPGQRGQAGPAGATGRAGIPGRIGAPGVQGLPGQKGQIGTPGIDGAPGVQGQKGYTGVPGLAGSRGVDGRPGEAGATGDAGIPGLAGVQGATGLAGPIGATGLPGKAGTPGQDGIPGVIGAQGATGLAGINGRAGLPGKVGATGLPGPDGLAGQAGRQGSLGVAGPAGPRGLAGQPGRRGNNGAPGRDGLAGQQGATGLTGIAGRPGLDGLVGLPGVDGRPGIAGREGLIGDAGARGLPGRAGAPGIIGDVGAAGIPGIIGAPGPVGLQGPSGATGLAGARGLDGIPGSAGATGATGLPGINGAAGATGLPGRAGNAGLPGAVGATGDSGQPGTPGQKGLTGLTGEKGDLGPVGDRGIAGIPGRAGIDGAAGLQGFTGATGIVGDVGQAGLKGPAGLQGARGQKGATGLPGVPGIKGLPGLAGTDGLPGPRGINGAPGAVGGTGATGSTGVPGVSGLDGEHGATGHTGPDGTRGLPGFAGPIGGTGATGLQGPRGRDGLPGQIGLSGSIGDQGLAGQAGSPGRAGQIGLTGATGLQGAAGNPGLDGRPGSPGVQGATGLRGEQGPVGLRGPNGLSGPIGATGPSGIPGVNGEQGATGLQGPRGIDGQPGARGQPGPQGLSGEPGTVGQRGSIGLQGPRGQDGLAGVPGQVGATGIQGATGVPGQPGSAGLPGSVGVVGLPGLQGAAGLRGQTGATGFTGQPGNIGSQGSIGLKGLNGSPGLRGANGNAGLPGPQGATGSAGLQGPRGDAGSPGSRGRPGSRGPIGATGLPGRNGIRGAPGERGVVGLAGLTGQAGPSGLPGKSEVNECLINNGGCDHACIDLVGSFVCKCRLGYKLQSDLRSCIDIDECVEYHPCHQKCTNTPGSFRCECFDGFYSNDPTSVKCLDTNECQQRNPCPDSQTCVNTYGSYKCMVKKLLQQAVSFDRYACSFDDSIPCIWLQVIQGWRYFGVSLTDDFNWKIDSGSSGIALTGPDRDHTSGRGNYIYLPSSTVNTGSAAWFSTHLILNGNQACMTFWYHMYGKDMGTMRVHQLYSAGRNAMIKLWELSGDQGNRWKRAKVNISPVTQGQYYVLLFEGVTGGQTSEMAIDDISFTEGRCTEDLYDPTEMTCNFRDADSCKWDQITGGWNLLGFSLLDDMNWIVRSGPTPGRETGPDADHTTGAGNYLYLPTTTAGLGSMVGKTAYFGTYLVLNRNAACMEFWYHMYGREMGTLELMQLYEAGPNQMVKLWENNGNKGKIWKKATVTIPVAPSGQAYVLLFKGTAGGLLSEMAIDDITITAGACQERPNNPINIELLTSSFDRLDYRWEQIEANWKQFNVALKDSLDWLLETRAPTPGTGPQSDHTSGRGNFLYVPVSTSTILGQAVTGKSAWFASHLVLNTQSACMTFWYHMNGREMGTMKLHQLYNAGRNSMKTLWEKTGDQGRDWNQAQLTIDTVPSGQSFLLLFEGIAGGQLSDMAIDDIELKIGSCTPESKECSFDDQRCDSWSQVTPQLAGEQDNLDWRIISGPTESQRTGRQTGPTQDHSGFGSYLYMEASSPSMEGERAWYLSDNVYARTACMEFFYHMYGENIGELKVHQVTDNARRSRSELWSKTGDQGNQWKRARVTLPYVPGDRRRILIEGVVGDGYLGDIAIDDIKITPEECSSTDTGLCTFDLNQVCEFQQVQYSTTVFQQYLSDERDWTSTTRGTGINAPSTDHSGNGYFMSLSYDAGNYYGKAMMVSKPISYSRACMHMWYHVGGNVQLKVNMLPREYGLSGMRTLWQSPGQTTSGWRLAEISVQDAARSQFVLIIEGSVQDQQGYIGIDDIQVKDGDCNRAVYYGQTAQQTFKESAPVANRSSFKMQAPAAYALFGGMAMMTILIIALAVVAVKYKTPYIAEKQA